jgi:hypothetical protein
VACQRAADRAIGVDERALAEAVLQWVARPDPTLIRPI